MLRIVVAVASALGSALCVLVIVATVLVVSRELSDGRVVPWLEVLPVLGVAIVGAIGLGVLAWYKARRARAEPPSRHVWVPALVGVASAFMVLGAVVVTAPAVGLLQSGQRTVGTVVSVSFPDLGSSEGRPTVQFQHVDGGLRSFEGNNPFGFAHEEGDPFDVVYDVDQCAATSCEGLAVVEGVAALRLQVILGIAVAVFFVAAPIVTAVVLRGAYRSPRRAQINKGPIFRS